VTQPAHSSSGSEGDQDLSRVYVMVVIVEVVVIALLYWMGRYFA
jgi:hypothetical protein